jgi:hypothetical protein
MPDIVLFCSDEPAERWCVANAVRHEDAKAGMFIFTNEIKSFPNCFS